MLLIVINLLVLILLFTIYLSFLVIINSILSTCESWVGRGRGPWEIVLTPQLENILEETLYTFNKIRKMHLQRKCPCKSLCQMSPCIKANFVLSELFYY